MNFNFYYNSHDENYKKPFGAVEVSQNIKIHVDLDSVEDLYLTNEDDNKSNNKNINDHTEVTLVYFKDTFGKYVETTGHITKELKMSRVDNGFEVTFSLDEIGLYFYYFRINIKDVCIYFGNSFDAKGGLSYGYNDVSNISAFQITCHGEIEETPNWYKEAVFYQIFPDRFFNGNEDGTLLSKKENSFIYSSWNDRPMYIKNEKGGIARWDFYGGNLKGIEKKIPYLKELGINGIYLNPIFEARSNHRYDTGDYYKIDPILGDLSDFKSLVNNCENEGIKIILDGVFNHTGADSIYFNAFSTYNSVGAFNSKESPYFSWYNFIEYPNTFESWWGITDLPNVNEEDEGYRKFMLDKESGVISYWLKNGAAGWRLDVADELPDNFIKGIRSTLDATKKDSVLIGEVWEDASNKIAYGKRREYLLGDELQGVMNYPFKDSIISYIKGEISAHDIYRIMMSLKENYPKESLYSNLNSIGTHDTKRINTEIPDFNKNRLAVALLLSLPGVPCIYYGDEVGVYGNSDPDNRATYPWGSENFEYYKVYKELIDKRHESKAFTMGDFIPFFYSNVFYYFRIFENDCYLVAINPNDDDIEVKLEESINGRDLTKHISNIKNHRVQVKANSYLIQKLV